MRPAGQRNRAAASPRPCGMGAVHGWRWALTQLVGFALSASPEKEQSGV